MTGALREECPQNAGTDGATDALVGRLLQLKEGAIVVVEDVVVGSDLLAGRGLLHFFDAEDAQGPQRRKAENVDPAACHGERTAAGSPYS